MRIVRTLKCLKEGADKARTIHTLGAMNKVGTLMQNYLAQTRCQAMGILTATVALRLEAATFPASYKL